MALSVSEMMLYSTMKLVGLKSGKEVGTGTGFFYQVDLGPGKFAPLIITNKHVVEDCDQIIAICHQAAAPPDVSPSGKFLKLTIAIGPDGVPGHPDPDVDLCVLPAAELMDKANAAGTPMLFVHLNKEIIPDAADWQYFDAIEELTMVGCPNGLYDEVNKVPLVRRGITATSLAKCYEGRPEFLVDMACFPGSSGSPVFLYNPNGYNDRKTNSYYMGKSRVLFVGVLYARPTMNSEGKIVMAKPRTFEVETMLHLGFAVRSTEILELEKIVKAIDAAGR